MRISVHEHRVGGGGEGSRTKRPRRCPEGASHGEGRGVDGDAANPRVMMGNRGIQEQDG